jgi:hypothetical protein
MDPRKQASEAIKDLMVNEKRSKLPLILAALAGIALLAGGGYWYSLPPDKRPTLDDLKGHAKTLSNTILNAPILNKAPTSAPSAPSPVNKKSAPSSSSDSTGLISN